MTKKYKYIIIEGVDGSGKTTLVNQLASALNAYTVYEPGGLASLRNMILNGSFNDQQVSLLIMADRLIVHKLISEYLQDSDVVSDRGFPSSYVYQSSVINLVSDLHAMFNDQLVRPDKIYILDIPIGTFKERMNELDKFDKVVEEDFETFRSAYTDLGFPNTQILDGRLRTVDLVDIILDDLAEI
jgi:dTMP kinase